MPNKPPPADYPPLTMSVDQNRPADALLSGEPNRITRHRQRGILDRTLYVTCRNYPW